MKINMVNFAVDMYLCVFLRLINLKSLLKCQLYRWFMFMKSRVKNQIKEEIHSKENILEIHQTNVTSQGYSL